MYSNGYHEEVGILLLDTLELFLFVFGEIVVLRLLVEAHLQRLTTEANVMQLLLYERCQKCIPHGCRRSYLAGLELGGELGIGGSKLFVLLLCSLQLALKVCNHGALLAELELQLHACCVGEDLRLALALRSGRGLLNGRGRLQHRRASVSLRLRRLKGSADGRRRSSRSEAALHAREHRLLVPKGREEEGRRHLGSILLAGGAQYGLHLCVLLQDYWLGCATPCCPTLHSSHRWLQVFPRFPTGIKLRFIGWSVYPRSE